MGIDFRAALAAGLAATILAGCGRSSSGPPSTALNTHVVTDSTGTAVTVPNSVTRIADAWPAHNEVVQMLGSGDKIVATVLTPASVPWLYTIDPALRQAQTVFTNTTVNAEALAQTHPDVVFADKSTQIAAKTPKLGIPIVQLGFQTYADLKQVVATTADVLGPAAQAQATRYNSYLDSKLAAISTVTSTIPAAQRPSVLHIYSLNPLVVDGTDSIIDAWITAAGGRNAAQISGNARPVSTEQVAQWNPDVIILASSAFAAADTGQQTLDKLSTDPFWSHLAAVRNHRAYINPTGGWHWDRYGIEEALQLQWAATTLHPEAFAGLDMVAETKSFYSRFLHYQLTDDQVSRILAGQNPA
ncbi:MAG TPA: ABC transporter substrate-binding protein [Pseudonocardiaceae bacterium]|jgi:iron complex transport system substrate-binding protein|nr:ABC transporter substrate-binding protein [Pseudonocardiaceae bacterium]